MGCNGDIVLRISPERLEIALEQQKEGGVVARKNISPEALAACILGSRYDERVQATGLLPEGCIAAILEEANTTFFIRTRNCMPISATTGRNIFISLFPGWCSPSSTWPKRVRWASAGCAW